MAMLPHSSPLSPVVVIPVEEVEVVGCGVAIQGVMGAGVTDSGTHSPHWKSDLHPGVGAE